MVYYKFFSSSFYSRLSTLYKEKVIGLHYRDSFCASVRWSLNKNNNDNKRSVHDYDYRKNLISWFVFSYFKSSYSLRVLVAYNYHTTPKSHEDIVQNINLQLSCHWKFSESDPMPDLTRRCADVTKVLTAATGFRQNYINTEYLSPLIWVSDLCGYTLWLCGYCYVIMIKCHQHSYQSDLSPWCLS